MSPWILSVLKAALPHVGTILSAAAPVFTQRHQAAHEPHTLHEQVAELQEAVTQQDSQIKELAVQIRATLEAVEQGAAQAERRYQVLLALSLATAVVALVALGLVLLLPR